MSIIPVVCYRYMEQQRLDRLRQEEERKERLRAFQEQKSNRITVEEYRALHNRGDKK